MNATDGAAAATRVSWLRASRGIYFLGFGVLFLLTTLNFIDWSFWFRALAWWPLILVAIGIRMIFQRSPAPWGVLLSPLAVFGALAWVAATTPAAARGGWADLVADAPRPVDRWSFEATLALTDLDLRAVQLPAGRLLEGRITPAGDRALRIRDWRGGTRVELSSFRHRRFNLLVPGRDRALDLGLSRDLPLELAIEGAFTGGGVDLSSARLTGLQLEGAFHGLELRLPRPDADVRVSVEGAFNDVEIYVPPEVPVSVVTDGAINIVDGRPSPPRSDRPGYRLRVEGFMNHVEVLADPDAAPAPLPESGENDEEPDRSGAPPPGGADTPSSGP